MRTSLLLLPALLACSGSSGDNGPAVEPDAAPVDGSLPTDLTRPTDASVTDSGPPQPPAAGCNQDGWCWAHPLPEGNTLLAIWGAATADVWAVGERGAILHWDGRDWSPVASPSHEFLRCVWGSGPSDVWAAGDRAVIHWDGNRWTMVKDDATITSIHGSGPDNVWFAWASTYLHWNGQDLKEGAHSNAGDNGYYNREAHRRMGNRHRALDRQREGGRLPPRRRPSDHHPRRRGHRPQPQRRLGQRPRRRLGRR
jgi:hypothetical protein